MLDYRRGYTSSWRVRRIDPKTWLPMEEVHGIESISVKRDHDSSLIESGDMDVTGSLDEGFYRIEAVSTQGGSVLEPIATMLFAPDGRDWSHRSWGGKMTGRSVLSYADEERTSPGSYAPKGSDGAQYAASMLRKLIPAPVEVEGSFTLSDHVVFDLGKSVLEAVWDVLNAAGWCMQIDGNGTVTVREKPSRAALSVDTANRGILMPTFSSKLPIDGVPNVMRVYDNGNEAEAVNDDPESPTSTVKRGRSIVDVEDNPTRVDGETLSAYATRALREKSEIYETMDVEREYASGVLPFSMVSVRLAEPGVDGDFMVMSQSIECGHGIKVGETWGRKQTWR